MFDAKPGGGSAVASAGKNLMSRTKTQPMIGSSPGSSGCLRYRLTERRIWARLSMPFAAPNKVPCL
jgi:hypothetical protein